MCERRLFCNLSIPQEKLEMALTMYVVYLQKSRKRACIWELPCLWLCSVNIHFTRQDACDESNVLGNVVMLANAPEIRWRGIYARFVSKQHSYPFHTCQCYLEVLPNTWAYDAMPLGAAGVGIFTSTPHLTTALGHLKHSSGNLSFPIFQRMKTDLSAIHRWSGFWLVLEGSRFVCNFFAHENSCTVTWGARAICRSLYSVDLECSHWWPPNVVRYGCAYFVTFSEKKEACRYAADASKAGPASWSTSQNERVCVWWMEKILSGAGKVSNCILNLNCPSLHTCKRGRRRSTSRIRCIVVALRKTHQVCLDIKSVIIYLKSCDDVGILIHEKRIVQQHLLAWNPGWNPVPAIGDPFRNQSSLRKHKGRIEIKNQCIVLRKFEWVEFASACWITLEGLDIIIIIIDCHH